MKGVAAASPTPNQRDVAGRGEGADTRLTLFCGYERAVGARQDAWISSSERRRVSGTPT